MKRAGLLMGIAAVCLVSLNTAQAASVDYTEGQRLFAQKSYRAAATKFEAAMKANPRDPNTIYYCALASQMCSNRTRARQLYEYLVSGFPGSQVANMASTALTQLGAAAPTSGTTGGSGSMPDTASASSSEPVRRQAASISIQSPDEFRVKCERGQGGHVFVVGMVNGQPVNFILDTGASTTGVDADKMAALGFGRAAAGEKFGISGIGDSKDVKGWHQKVSFQVGNAYVRDFPITVQDHEAPPLLGQDFLKYFDTEIDPNAGEVIFRKKGTGRRVAVQPRGTVDVPFTVGSQGHLYVMVEINGRPLKMMFDTGAGGVSLSQKDLKKVGLEIPAGAREGMSSGVAGSVRNWSFPVERMKLGTIVKENIEVHVSDNANADIPSLLGQGFYGDYQHKVDQTAKVIHFYPQQ